MARLTELRDRFSEEIVGAAIVAEQYDYLDPEASGRAIAHLRQAREIAYQMIAFIAQAETRF